ncbi:MAG: hypothetical protein RLZZ338_3114 [Cyanobacteriota bacterium]|jgi:hypothetical protein
MNIIQHLWQLILCLVIVAGPLPGCWLLIGLNNSPLDRDSVTHRLLIILTGWCIFQVGLGLILGAFHLLYLPVLVGVEIVFFILGFIRLRSRSLSPFSDWISDLLKVTRSLQPLELLIIASLTFVSVILINKITTLPMTGYDSLWFQLPPIARWYQTGTFTFLDPLGQRIVEHPDAHLYPYNWQILGLFFVMPFWEDFLVAFPGLIAWVILGLSVYRNSRIFGASRLYSLAALSLILTTPMIQDHVNSFYLDLPLAAIFTFCIYVLICYTKTRSNLDFFLLFLSWGFLLGLKSIGFIYGLFILAIWLLDEIKFIINSGSLQKTNLNSSSVINFWKIGGILGGIFLAAFWYIRIWYQKQPVSMAELESWQLASAVVSDTPLLQKLYEIQKTTLISSFNFTNFSHWKICISAIITRLQIPFIIMFCQVILSPIIFFSPVINQEKKKNLVLILILVLITAFLYGNTPYSAGGGLNVEGRDLFSHNIRYGFIFVSMLSIAAAVTATLLNTSKYLMVIMIFISSLIAIIRLELFNAFTIASFQRENTISGGPMMFKMILSKPQEGIDQLLHYFGENIVSLFFYVLVYLGLIIILSLIFLKYPVLPSSLIREYWQKFKPTIAISLCLIILISASWVAREKRDLQRTDVYQGIYEFLEVNLKQNDKIAYSSSIRNYLFYGKHFDQQVLHIPLLDDTNNGIDKWVKNVRKSGAKYVVIGPTFKDFNDFKAFYKLSEDGILKPVFGKKNDFIYHPIICELKRE